MTKSIVLLALLMSVVLSTSTFPFDYRKKARELSMGEYFPIGTLSMGDGIAISIYFPNSPGPDPDTLRIRGFRGGS